MAVLHCNLYKFRPCVDLWCHEGDILYIHKVVCFWRFSSNWQLE